MKRNYLINDRGLKSVTKPYFGISNDIQNGIGGNNYPGISTTTTTTTPTLTTGTTVTPTVTRFDKINSGVNTGLMTATNIATTIGAFKTAFSKNPSQSNYTLDMPDGTQQTYSNAQMQQIVAESQKSSVDTNTLLAMMMQGQSNTPEKKDNTMLYVGLGVGGLLLLGMIFMMTQKK